MMSTSQQPAIVQSMRGGTGTAVPTSPGVVPEMLPQQVHSTSQNILYTIQNDGGHLDLQTNGNVNGTKHYGAHSGKVHEGQYLHNLEGAENGNGHQEEEDDDTSKHADSYEAGGNEESDSSVEPIKIFVGQVPRTMEEADLFSVFEKYGPMEDVCIIRDKHTGQHRGCAFVTFYSKESAEACGESLHNKVTLEGAKRPLQIKPAGRKLKHGPNSVGEHENKVFVGMLPRNVAEDTVRELFEPFGMIKGIHLIRSTDGIKKGCAFVKYAYPESAIAAIHSLHGSLAIEDSDRPLIVKFADTKNHNRHQRNHHPHHGMYADLVGPIGHSPPGSFSGNMYYMQPPSNPMHHPLFAGHAPGHITPNMVSSNTSPAGSYSSGHGHFPPSFHGNATSTAPPSYIYQPIYDTANTHYSDPRTHHQSTQRPREGPAGANLFIYHLPHDLTDADLATAFNPFGNVISAKVYVDRFTGESKGFGFVSYDSIISAEHAIEQMNGFQIGNKRLKVQHKRVNHRPPISVPAIQHHQQQYYAPAHSEGIHQGPILDVPPSIEISGPGVGVDNAYSSGHIPHEISQPPDVNALASQFQTLNAD